MARKLETTPPLGEEGYARTFAVLTTTTTEYIAMNKIAGKVITESNFDQKPVQMLSVGAGTGHFEVQLVKDLGLKLEYIFAIEPNTKHVPDLEAALKSFDVEYDISKSFFNKDFEFDKDCERAKQNFDFILFSHSLYGFDDPFEAISHATKFLKPSGKMLIINQGSPSSAELFTYLMNNSDPDVFPAGKVIGNHSLTAEKMISYFQKEHPSLPMSLIEEMTYVDFDSFVRKTGEEGNDEAVSFFLQAEYKNLSKEAQNDIYNIVASECELIDDKYCRRHLCVGIVLSLEV